jgi:ParB family chromosome partitioning protein
MTITEDFKKVSIKKIRPDPNNPRKGFIDEEDLNLMAQTLKHHGIIQPIEVTEDYQIIVGELRWRAAKIAGLEEIPCKVMKGLSKEQVLERQLIENFHRQNVNLGECIVELKQLLLSCTRQKKCNADEGIKDLSERLGVNRQWLSDLLQMDKNAPQYVKKEVEKYYETKGEKGISASQAVEIAKAPKIIQRDLLDKAKAKVPSKEIRKERQQFERKEITLKEIRKPFGRDEHIPDPLNFRKDHIEMILKEKKIQTTRFWHNAKVGDRVPIHLHEPNIAEVEIVDNEDKQLKDFTEEDAQREGGYSLKEFKEVWKKIHGEWNPEVKVKVFKFKLLK